MKNKIVNFIDQAIFAIRWLLAPMYLALYAVLILYAWKYVQLIVEIAQNIQVTTNQGIMLALVELVDMTMIANLIVMTTTGGYSIFVKEFKIGTLEDRPRWLNNNFSSMDQKIKFGVSLTAISCIDLLNKSIKSSSWDILLKQMSTIGVFALATLAFCVINWLSHIVQPHKESHETLSSDSH